MENAKTMITETTFSVPEITCDGCAKGIKNALSNLEGIERIEVDVAAKTVAVSYEPNSVMESRIISTLDDAGYPVDQG